MNEVLPAPTVRPSAETTRGLLEANDLDRLYNNFRPEKLERPENGSMLQHISPQDLSISRNPFVTVKVDEYRVVGGGWGFGEG